MFLYKNVDNLKAYNPPRPIWYEIQFQDDELQSCAVVQYWRKELGVSENVKYSFILQCFNLVGGVLFYFDFDIILVTVKIVNMT